RYWRNLDAQGYRYRGFERAIDRLVFRVMDRIAPLALRLSLVSCVEHINAYLGHEFLRQRILERAHPDMRVLMEWHFAEE
ncbi:metal-dependent hydrolase, partial [Acinetobacter baumannii]